MARKIKLDQIDDVMSEAVSALVAATTLEWTARVKLATPVDTGRLRANWQTSIKKFEGTVFNNVAYAEPVCFSVNLPPSWGNNIELNKALLLAFQHLSVKN